MPVRSKWLMGFLFSFFLCYENDELTLPVAEDSHLLNALQICLMDTSCQGLAVTSPNQKYFPLRLVHQVPALLSQWKMWKGWKRSTWLLKKPSISREYEIILSRLILLASAKRQLGKPAQSLSGMQSLKEPPHPFPQSRVKIAKFAGRPLKKLQGKRSFQVFFSNLLEERRENKTAALDIFCISVCIW